MSKAVVTLTPFLERKYRHWFNCMDFNKDGKVTEADVELIVNEAREKHNLSEEELSNIKKEITEMFKQFLFNTDGNEGTADDFINNCNKLTEEDYRRADDVFYSDLFKAVDTNKNGTICLKEFLDFCDLVNVGRINGKHTFKLIDEGGDGVISKEEFLKFAERYSWSDDEADPSQCFYGPLPPA